MKPLRHWQYFGKKRKEKKTHCANYLWPIYDCFRFKWVRRIHPLSLSSRSGLCCDYREQLLERRSSKHRSAHAPIVVCSVHALNRLISNICFLCFNRILMFFLHCIFDLFRNEVFSRVINCQHNQIIIFKPHRLIPLHRLWIASPHQNKCLASVQMWKYVFLLCVSLEPWRHERLIGC